MLTLLATSNTWQKQCAYHALATLEIGNLSCIPVYYGSTYPLINTYERFQAWEAIHGVLPWQGVFAPYNATAEALGSDPTANATYANRISAGAFLEGYPNITAVEGKSAAQFMIEQVRKYPGQVSIYAAGAMTNVALAIRLDEEFASLAKELVIMGGYLDVNMYQVCLTSISFSLPLLPAIQFSELPILILTSSRQPEQSTKQTSTQT